MAITELFRLIFTKKYGKKTLIIPLKQLQRLFLDTFHTAEKTLDSQRGHYILFLLTIGLFVSFIYTFVTVFLKLCFQLK
ncbi:conserved hypothetical protein [Bacillus vallismortis]